MTPRPPLVLRLALRLFPAALREEHGEEMVSGILAERAQARWSGPTGALRFWTRTLFDLLGAAARLRARPAPDLTAPAGGPRRRHAGGRVQPWLRDLRFGLRSLARTPLVTGVVILTLALGVGMNTAIFSVVDSVLLEPLPYPDADRLVLVEGRVTVDGSERPVRLAGAAFTALQEDVAALESAAAFTRIRQNLTGGDSPLMVEVGWASANLFEMLEVGVAVGRTFRPGDPPGTLVLDHGLWLRHFGGDPGVLGRTLRLDGHAYTVVGVLPPGFALHVPWGGGQADVWKVPDDWWQNGDVWTGQGLSFGILRVVGYRAADASPARLDGELAAAAARHREGSAELEKASFDLAARPLHEAIVGEARPTLLLLLGAVGFVLLIACANVMNLLLVRAQARRREIAVRLALGSSRFGVVRLLLAESVLLAAAGGAAGIGLGVAGTQALAWLQPPGLPRVSAVEVDASVLGFACLAALGSVLLFGLAPALGASRTDLRSGVGDGRTAGVPGAQRASRALVAAQLALSLVLLIGAGLLMTSLARLGAIEPGFSAEDRLAFSVSLPGTRYERPLGTDRFFRELEDRVAALPGVRAAGVVWPQPLSGPGWQSAYAGGDVRAEDNAIADYYVATPGYFEAGGVPVLEGRVFDAGDTREVALVSRALAERAWPGRSAVGQTIAASPWGGDDVEFRVVGVVGDVRTLSLREAGGEALWFDSRGWSWTDWQVDYVVHARVPPESLVGPIRGALLSLDPEVPLADARPLRQDLEAHLAPSRFALLLIGLFAVVAAVLAVVGLYGVVSYAVGRRTREIGIRVALGAGRSRILGLVLGQGARLAATGLALGLFGAWALTRLLESLLFEVSAHDPLTFCGVALGLAAVALAACLPAARRAALLDPARSLRVE